MSGLAFLIIFIVALAGALIVVMRADRRGRARGEAGCGRCRYPIRGLTTPICPECGSDLRVVGFVQPGQRRPLALIWQMLCLALLVSVLGILVANTLPIPRLIEWRRTLELASDEPTFARTVRVGATWRAWRIVPPNRFLPTAASDPGAVSITVVNPATKVVASHVAVYFDPPHYRVQQQGVQEYAGQFDHAAAANLLSDVGLPVGEEKLARAAAVIEKAVNSRVDSEAIENVIANAYSRGGRSPRLPAMYVTGSSSSTRDVSARWQVLAAVALSAMIWLLGCWLLYRRWRAPRAYHAPFDDA